MSEPLEGNLKRELPAWRISQKTRRRAGDVPQGEFLEELLRDRNIVSLHPL